MPAPNRNYASEAIYMIPWVTGYESSSPNCSLCTWSCHPTGGTPKYKWKLKFVNRDCHLHVNLLMHAVDAINRLS